MVAVFYPMIVFWTKNPASFDGGDWFGFEGRGAWLLARTGMKHSYRLATGYGQWIESK
jgi:hypothetical protein